MYIYMHRYMYVYLCIYLPQRKRKRKREIGEGERLVRGLCFLEVATQRARTGKRERGTLTWLQLAVQSKKNKKKREGFSLV